MTIVEKRMYLFLLVGDALAIIISMVAGPFGSDTLAIGAAVSAIMISVCLIYYSLYFWRKKER